MSGNIFKWLVFLIMGLSLVFGFNNCDTHRGTVVSNHSASSTLRCADYVNAGKKVNAAGFGDLDEATLQVTPPSGDWTDPSSDDLRSEQDYLDILAADQAHQIFYEGIGPSQQPVVVAVIDTGVDYNHSDLTGQMYRRNGQIVGYDFFNRDGDPVDDEGHGTHVAGLVAAEGHNGEGIRGGAPEFVKIMSIKVLGSDGSLPISRFGDFSQSVRFAVDQGADVINMSLGMTVNVARFNDQVFVGLKAALQYALDRGVVAVIASGNDNIELNNVRMTYPARFGSDMDGVITVGAYDTTAETISPFSNFSPVYVEVQAPGSMNSGRGLISTWPGDGYRYAPGTSMATPLVAGLVALTKVYLRKKGIVLTASQIEDLVKESSIKYQSLSHLAQQGRVINYKSMADRLVRIYESGIIEHPKSLRLKVGQTGRLAIRMNEFSSRLLFQWYHNGKRMSGANQIELLIRNATHRDEGEYHLKVRLESGDLVSSLKGKVEVIENDSCE